MADDCGLPKGHPTVRNGSQTIHDGLSNPLKPNLPATTRGIRAGHGLRPSEVPSPELS